MPSGGKRAGAGRKPGPRWAAGDGTPRDKKARAQARAVVREHLSRENATPLDVLMNFATDEEQPREFRAQCAAWSLPYCFPRLSMAVVGTTAIASKDDSAAAITRLLERVQRIADAGITGRAALPVIDGSAAKVAA